MDNNQNGGVDRLMRPFRPVACRTIRSPALTLSFTFQLVYAGWTSFHDHLLLQLPD